MWLLEAEETPCYWAVQVWPGGSFRKSSETEKAEPGTSRRQSDLTASLEARHPIAPEANKLPYAQLLWNSLPLPAFHSGFLLLAAEHFSSHAVMSHCHFDRSIQGLSPKELGWRHCRPALSRRQGMVCRGL